MKLLSAEVSGSTPEGSEHYAQAHPFGRIFMMISSENVLNRQLKPLCSRDNHVMKYVEGCLYGYLANTRGDWVRA
jgi:hypothetical protein